MTLRELAAAVAHEATKSARSPRWRSVSRAFLKMHPACAACGSRRAVVPHHVVPFHVDPALELAADNLIALCLVGRQDHRLIGHGGAWTTWNAAVRADAEELLEHPRLRHRIEARAHVTRRRARLLEAPVPWYRLAWHVLVVVLTTRGLLRALLESPAEAGTPRREGGP